MDLRAGDLGDRYDVARTRRQCHEGLDGAEVQLAEVVVGGVGVRGEVLPVAGAALAGEVATDLAVGFEERGHRPHLGAHVGDHVAIPDRQRGHPRPVVLDQPARCPVGAVAPQHLQDDVLGAHPGLQFTDEADTPDLGHRQVQGLAGENQRHRQATGADGQHAERSRGARMAVGAEQAGAGAPEGLLVHGVADPVARPAEPQPEPLAGAAHHQVVLGVVPVRLQQQVIDVADGEIDSRTVDAHGLEFERDQRPDGVVHEDLVNAECDLRARNRVACHEVRLDEPAGERLSHGHGLTAPGGGTSPRTRDPAWSAPAAPPPGRATPRTRAAARR